MVDWIVNGDKFGVDDCFCKYKWRDDRTYVSPDIL